MKGQEKRLDKLEEGYENSKEGVWRQYTDWLWSDDRYIVVDFRRILNQEGTKENIKEICKIVLREAGEPFEVQPGDQDILDEAQASIPDDLHKKMCAAGLAY